jgi:hypothetical protein
VARSERFNVEINATDNASQTIDEVADKTERLAAGASVDITATDEASEVVEDVGEKVEDLDGQSADPTLGATDDASEVVDEVTEKVEDLDEAEASPTLGASNEASGEIDAVEEELAGLNTVEASPGITLSGDDASTVTEVTEALETLDTTEASASMNVEDTNDAGGMLDGIVGNLTTVAAGFLTGLAAGNLTSVFDSAADRAIDVQNLATMTGESLANATAFSESMELAEIPIMRAQTMIGKVNDKLIESPELAARLGIEIGNNQSPLDIFVAAVDALNSGQLTANERLQLATELFGTRGAAMVGRIDTLVGDLSDDMENMPEWQAITDQDVEAAQAYKQAMDFLGDIQGEIAQTLLTKVVPAVQGLKIALDSLPKGALKDLIPVDINIGDWLNAGGSAVEEYFKKISDSEETARAFRDAQEAGRISTVEFNEIMADGVATMEEVTIAAEDEANAANMAADAFGLHAELAEEDVAATEEAARAYEESIAEIDAQKEALDGVVESLQASIDKHIEQAEVIQGGGDVWLDQRDAIRDAEQAEEDYTEAIKEREDETRTATEIDRDHEEALDNVVRAHDKVADAAVDAARQTAESEGATLDATRALDIHNDSLLESARTMNGPQRDAIIAHVLRINGIPEERITEITAMTDDAALAAADRELDNTSAARQALMRAAIDREALRQAQYELRVLTTPRSVLIQPIYRAPGGGGMRYQAMAGSPYTPRGLGLVGEDGPELVELPEGSEVHTAAETQEMMRNGWDGDGRTTINNTVIHMPPGTRPRDVIRAERADRRRNGPR